jgi:hypothetical protein
MHPDTVKYNKALGKPPRSERYVAKQPCADRTMPRRR